MSGASTMPAYREPRGKDYLKSVLIVAAAISALVGSVIVLTLLLNEIGFLIWLPIGPPLTIYLLVRWHSKSTAYKCPNCGHEFTIGFFKDLLAPHSLTKYNLVCTKCGERVWAKVLVRE